MEGIASRTKTVGPTTKTKSMISEASTTLAVESHFTPLCTPEKAERTKAALSEAMMINWACSVLRTSEM